MLGFLPGPFGLLDGFFYGQAGFLQESANRLGQEKSQPAEEDNEIDRFAQNIGERRTMGLFGL